MNQNKQISFDWTPAQFDFLNDPTRFKCVAKGRRLGTTLGAAMFIIREMLIKSDYKVLWVDVIYGNINRYYNRCFLPILSKLPKEVKWNWSNQQKQLIIGTNYLDMRSADRRESLEGFGYNFIFLNEAGIILKDRNLWNITIAPMAMDYKATVLFAGTPKGKRDLSHGSTGKQDCLYFELYQKGLNHEPDWKSWQYSSYDNPFLEKEDIDSLASEIPSVVRRQEIFGEFLDITENAIFHSDWFEYVDEIPAGVKLKVMSLDTAYTTKTTSDYSACVVVYQTLSTYYVIDCYNVKVEFPELIKLCEDIYEKYRVDAVLIEGKASGQSLIQTMRSQSILPVKECQPTNNPVFGTNDKIARAAGISPICEAKKVKIVKGEWNKMFLDQILNFPSGYDDMCDAFVQALQYLKDFRGQSPKFITENIRIPQLIRGFTTSIPAKDRLRGYGTTNQDNLRGFTTIPR